MSYFLNRKSISEERLMLEPDNIILDVTYILNQDYCLTEVFNIMPLTSIIEELLKHQDNSIEDNINLLHSYLESYLFTIATNSELDYYFTKIDEIENLFIVISYFVNEIYDYTLKGFYNEYIFKKWIDKTSIILEKVKYEQ